MTDIPTDVAGLCDELATLYRQLGEAITPTTDRPDRSMARDVTTRWCALHEHLVPYGPVERRCHPGAPKLTLAAGLMPTARPDNGARRGVPGSRPPLSGPALDALVAQEGIWTAAVDLANDIRLALGHTTRHRQVLPALAALPELVEAFETDLYGPLRQRVMRGLRVARQRARDVLGLSRDVKWLGECPAVFADAVTVRTRGGIVEDSPGCWTLDLAAMTEGDGDQEIWRRSRLAMLRDEERPRVVCFACWYEPDERELARLALEYLVGTAGG